MTIGGHRSAIIVAVFAGWRPMCRPRATLSNRSIAVYRPFDDPEAESGGDEEARLASQGPNVAARVGCRFERAQRRRPDSQNTSAASARDRDGFSGGGRNIKFFGVHSMLRKILGFDGREC